MKKVIFGFVATLLFISCENETTNNESNYSKSNTLEQNLNEFAKIHTSKSKEFVLLLKNESSSVSFDDNSYNEIMALQNEKDVEKYFNEKGFLETKKVINIIKELESNYRLFIQNTASFNSLDNNSKYEIIEKALNFEMDKDIFWGNFDSLYLSRISCSEQAAIDTQRCYRNQAIGLGFSFVGGLLTGGVGGWLGAAASTTAYHFCIKDMQQDFYNCTH